MKAAKGNYVLESNKEGDRLDRQSRMKAFSPEAELRFLQLQPGQRILDAGCGSGIVSHHLSRLASGIQVVGWDFAQNRVDEAQQKYGSSGNVRFAQRDLLKLNADSDPEIKEFGRFDAIVCRFVLRHFPQKVVPKVVRNLVNALKPGGTLCCIDVDGVLGDFSTGSTFLNKSLAQIRESKDVSFGVAMKMPSLFIGAGLEEVDWHVVTSEFKGDELSEETENLRQSFQNAKSFAVKVLRGEKNFKRFCKEFTAAMADPENIRFYNRIVALGKKPKAKPQLVD